MHFPRAYSGASRLGCEGDDLARRGARLRARVARCTGLASDRPDTRETYDAALSELTHERIATRGGARRCVVEWTEIATRVQSAARHRARESLNLTFFKYAATLVLSTSS